MYNMDKYLEKFGKLCNQIINLHDNDDFLINEPQMDKFFEVVEFFTESAKECNGKLEPIKLLPKEEHGGITATFVVLDLSGDSLEKFKAVIQHASAVTFDSTTDNEVCISLTVPNVFKLKD